MAKRESNEKILTIIGLVIIAVIVIVVVLLVRNKNNNTSTALTPAQTTAAKQQIETNWKTFFAASTSLQDREKLLQNGSNFSQPIQEEFTALSSQASSAVISNVDVESSTSATVAYTINLNGQPVLRGQTGKAVFADNTWQVSDTTLCGLLSMGGNNPPACKNL